MPVHPPDHFPDPFENVARDKGGGRREWLTVHPPQQYAPLRRPVTLNGNFYEPAASRRGNRTRHVKKSVRSHGVQPLQLQQLGGVGESFLRL